MGEIEVRERDRQLNLWGGFKDELVATAMTLTLLVLGSFLLTERMLFTPKETTDVVTQLESLPTPATPPEPTDLPQTLGIQDPPKVASEGSVVLTEVPYGQDGDYDTSMYAVSFRSPRISFDSVTNTKRRLIVNVWVKNKSAPEGILPRLTASIIKDGVVIVPAAALSIPRPKTLLAGEEMSFSATLSLIEGTDVRELKFKPGNDGADTSHFLYP